MVSGIYPKCKCKKCGLVFDSYVKTDLCKTHYWELRDFAENYVLKPSDILTGHKNIIFKKSQAKIGKR
jgi:hypothetical protein